jgi:hypothetical protein
MQPPAQVVTLAFVCAAVLIDLSMVQAKRDPPCRSRSRAKEASVCALIDDCPAMQLPHFTKSLVRGSMAARSAYANCTAALRCATRYRQNANMRTITAASAISEALTHTPPAPLLITSTLSFSKSHAHAHAPLASHGPSPPSLAASPPARFERSFVA